MPKVSVIMPTRNRAHFLPKAIESVLSQTFRDWELIVIDDGSTDETKKLLESFSSKDSRIRYVFQDHKGISAARAHGTQLMQSEYVTFLDDDDEFAPNKLKDQVAFLDTHSEVGLVYSYVDVIQGGIFQRKWPYRVAGNFMELIKDCMIQTNAVLIRTECFKKLGTFRSDFKGGDDYEMWLRIAKFYPIAFLPGTVGMYNWHDTNMSYDQRKRCFNNVNIFKAVNSYDLSSVERSEVVKRVIELTYTKGSDALSARRYQEALFYFGQALRFSPVIGTYMTWGRSRNWFYGFLRPYLAMIYCGFMFLKHSIYIKGQKAHG